MQENEGYRPEGSAGVVGGEELSSWVSQLLLTHALLILHTHGAHMSLTHAQAGFFIEQACLHYPDIILKHLTFFLSV